MMPIRPEIGFAPTLCISGKAANGMLMMKNTKNVMRAQLRPFPIMNMKNPITPRTKNEINITNAGDAISVYIDASITLRKTPIPSVM
jgi:hypothetical protein